MFILLIVLIIGKLNLMNKKDIKNSIQKYFEGKLSKEELAHLEEEITQKENVELFKKMVKEHYSADGFDNTKAYQNFKKSIETQKIVRLNRRKNIYSVLKYAAVIVGITLSITVFWKREEARNLIEEPSTEVTLELEDGSLFVLNKEQQKNIVKQDGEIVGKQDLGKLKYENGGTKEVTTAYNILRVPYGKRFEVVLSDGTEVYLNAGSRLRYPVKFLKGERREVELEGEAYFKVTKDKHDSFIVSSNAVNTEVYGTEFNISSYENEERVAVVLVEGKVAVSRNDINRDSIDQKFLRPNEMASYTKDGGTILITEENVAKHIAWIDGVLFFKNSSFQNILRKLERHFNLTIQNNYKEINGERFTGVFDVEGIEKVLKTMQNHTFFNYTLTKNQLIINP